jgi:hypothetical protein
VGYELQQMGAGQGVAAAEKSPVLQIYVKVCRNGTRQKLCFC